MPSPIRSVDDSASRLARLFLSPSRKKQFESSAGSHNCLQRAFKVYALAICAVLSILIYVCSFIISYDSTLTNPPDESTKEFNKMVESIIDNTPTIEEYTVYKHFMLNLPSITNGFCEGLTAVICETFLATFPENKTYHDIVQTLPSYVANVPEFERNSTTLWDWEPLLEPIDKVVFKPKFTTDEILAFGKCFDAVRKVRKVIDFPEGYYTPEQLEHQSSMRQQEAELFSIGTCRLSVLGSFQNRAESLWSFCSLGCGTKAGEPKSIDWSMLCDAVLFTFTELTALHGCGHRYDVASLCSAAGYLSLIHCGIGNLIENEFHE